MAKEDMPKTTFVTNDDIYYYTCMPVGLKNIGVEFQESMNKAFDGLIGKTIEVYVDDIIVNSKDKNTAMIDLREVFLQTLQNWHEAQSKKMHFWRILGKVSGVYGFPKRNRGKPSED